MSRLVIKNVDFSAQKVTTLSDDVILEPLKIYSAGDNTVRYYNNTEIPQQDTMGSVPYPTALNKECVFVYNVEDFVGEELNIRACHLHPKDTFTAAAFASSIDEATMNSVEQTAKTASEAILPGSSVLTSVERFNVSTENNVSATIQKTVPSGAKYLVFTNSSALFPNLKVCVWKAE